MFRQSTCTLSKVDCRLYGSGQPGSNSGRTIDPAFADEVQQLIMQMADKEVSDRLQAAWNRGSHAAEVMQTEADQSFTSAAESLQEVHSAQQSFEAENELLKQLITALSERLSHLSATPSAAASPDATSALFTPSPMNDGSACQSADAMGDLWRAATSGDDAASLPTFPPTQPMRQVPVPPLAAKVSLADVLGISDSTDTPSTARSAAASETSSSGWEDVDAFIFSLTLRLADDTELGLSTSQSGHDRHLRIEGVLPGGAAEAWNRQCGSSGSVEKVMQPGDKIVGVNAVAGDPQAMLRECSSRQLLRLQIVRANCSAPPSPRDTSMAKVEAPFLAGMPGRRSMAPGAKATWRV